ncbi:phage integrase N-terminal SAM-like domain-containing protein [Roseiflexus sp.]|uniref:phage integrase N-terminal SAM-like domain-containing protein n=1 Tax=Roseiflexus sp. TaxID=2562120 RepID=UPI00345934D0
MRRSIVCHSKRHSQEMGAQEIEDFLSHLDVNEHVAASPQNQVPSALLFLSREALHQAMGTIGAPR